MKDSDSYEIKPSEKDVKSVFKNSNKSMKDSINEASMSSHAVVKLGRWTPEEHQTFLNALR